ncbi:uncharacterized protein LOC143370004 [Andrena cerasifolii]|uniref:uncharacterized protein LOC143370004 n=1 Tax=Andrena cerasifolii TaxID=2819439 RepID=UPI004037F03E
MLCRCLKLFAPKRSRYISWNSLFLWAFGLWIALCTSDIYHSDVLSQGAAMICQQNWNSGIAYNIAIRTETMENLSYIDATNCNFCNIVLAVKTLFQSIYMLLFVCLAVPLLCIHDRIKRSIDRPSNIANNLCSIGKYLKAVAKYCKENILDRKMTNENDPPSVLQSELIAKCEIRAQQLRGTLIHNWKEEYALEGNQINCLFNASIRTVQNEVTLGCYTLLLFNNYELYRYFNAQLLKSTCHFFTKYPAAQDPGYVVNDGKWLSECKAISNLELKSGMRKRIISSSPEFQKFLASLKRSRVLYPCMLEVSTSYLISIKSTYK